MGVAHSHGLCSSAGKFSARSRPEAGRPIHVHQQHAVSKVWIIRTAAGARRIWRSHCKPMQAHLQTERTLSIPAPFKWPPGWIVAVHDDARAKHQKTSAIMSLGVMDTGSGLKGALSQRHALSAPFNRFGTDSRRRIRDGRRPSAWRRRRPGPRRRRAEFRCRHLKAGAAERATRLAVRHGFHGHRGRPRGL
mgnify:CR=1 FL=1